MQGLTVTITTTGSQYPIYYHLEDDFCTDYSSPVTVTFTFPCFEHYSPLHDDR